MSIMVLHFNLLMPIPEIEEPRVLSGLQQSPMNVPFKKRRFPVIRSESPPEDEINPRVSEDSEHKKKQDSSGINDKLPATIARNVEPSSGCGVSKISDLVVKREREGSHSNPIANAEAGIVASIYPQQGNPCLSLGLIDDAAKNVNAPLKENIEGNGGLEASKSKKIVELSVGLKESTGSATSKQIHEEVSKSDNKSHPSLLSLSPCKETLDSGANQVSGESCSNRSNWDLNTTMDVWAGSTNSSFIDKNEFSKADDCHNPQSSLIMSGTTGLSLNKGNNKLVDSTREQCNRQHQVDFLTGFTHDVPCSGKDSLKDHSATSSKLLTTNVRHNLSLQLFEEPAVSMNLVRIPTVKSEPVDQESKHNSSTGSSCSSSVGLSNINSVKRERAENDSLETAMHFSKGDLIQQPSFVTALPSSVNPQELVDCRSIKSEEAEAIQESCTYKAVVTRKNAGRVMQHQESCVSSSVLPSPLMPPEFFQRATSTFLQQTMGRDLSNHSEPNFHRKESKDPENVLDRPVDAIIYEPSDQIGIQLRQCKVEKLMSDGFHGSHAARVDELSLGSCKNANIVSNVKKKESLSGKTLEKTSSYCGPREIHVDPSVNRGHKIGSREDEYEDGEIREAVRSSAGDVSNVVTEKDQIDQCVIKISQPSVPSVGRIVMEHDVDENYAAPSENQDEIHDDPPIDESLVTRHELNTANNTVQKVSAVAPDVGVDEERSISTATEKQLDLSVNKDVEECSGKGASNEILSNESQGIVTELENNTTDSFDADVSSRTKDSALTVPEASPKCSDIAKDSINTNPGKDSNNATNKSRIINLPRSSAVTTFRTGKFVSNRLLTSKSTKERDYDFDGEMMPRVRRNERYTTGANRFSKDKIHDQPFKSSRRNFSQEKGMMMSGRYGSGHHEWDSDQNFAPEAYRRPYYDPPRQKHESPISEFEREPYNSNMGRDNASFSGNNGNFPLFRRRRPSSPGGIDISVTRKHRGISRNIGTTNSVDGGSTFVGFRHADKFLRRLSSSDNASNPAYNDDTQPLYDEIEGHMRRGNRRFSPIQRRGFPRTRSKSPVRPRTRSPGPWKAAASPRRRSQDFNHELNRMGGRMRSPSYGGLRNTDYNDSGNRRSPPLQLFLSNARRSAETNREMGDERRKFIGNRRPVCSFRPRYNDDGDDDGENLRFSMNDDSPNRLYGYRHEFPERSDSARGINDFDRRRMEHHQISRRVRDMADEHNDRDYRPSGGRVWGEEDLTTEASSLVKRRRY